VLAANRARQPEFKSWARRRENLVSYTLADGAESPISFDTAIHALKLLSSISDMESTVYMHLVTFTCHVMKGDASR